jgi:hypothetical protein
MVQAKGQVVMGDVKATLKDGADASDDALNSRRLFHGAALPPQFRIAL